MVLQSRELLLSVLNCGQMGDHHRARPSGLGDIAALDELRQKAKAVFPVAHAPKYGMLTRGPPPDLRL